MKFEIEKISAHLTKPLHFGLKFGDKGDEGVPKLVFAVDVKTEDGRTARGVASDFAMVKWFDPKNDPDKYISAVKRIASTAVNTAKSYYNGKDFKPFAMSLDRGQKINDLFKDPQSPTTRLAAQEIHALEERAIIDALGRATGKNGVDLIREESDLAEIEGGKFNSVTMDQVLLPSSKMKSYLPYRHTVGIDFPLRADDRAIGQSGQREGRYLEQEIKEHGIKRFKIKITNDVDGSLDYLKKARDLIEQYNGHNEGDYLITLDANQKFTDKEWGKLENFVQRFKDELPTMFVNTKYIEQPFASDALANVSEEGTAAISRIKDQHGLKILIDESGDSHGSFATAISKGIDGASMKGCKGIIHAIYDSALAIVSGIDKFITAEDLTVLEPSDLAQNLNVFAAMPMIEDAELNGAFNTTAGEWLTNEQRADAFSDMQSLYSYIFATEDRPSKLKPKIPKGTLGYPTRDLTGPGLGGPGVYFNPDDINTAMVEEIAAA